LTPPYISHIERGVKTPSLHALIRLADALGVSMDWLLGRERPAAEQQVITEIALTCRDILREGLPKE
jgi:transcriptional regulator with XRE-family HTH domain